MPVYSDEQRSFRRRFQFAALDLPIPDKFEFSAEEGLKNDFYAWNHYVNELPIPSQIRKLGQAIDQLIDLSLKAADPTQLPEQDQEKLHAKWTATNALSAAVGRHFLNNVPEGKPQYTECKSDLHFSTSWVIDLLKSVNSSDTATWENRVRKIDTLLEPIQKSTDTFRLETLKKKGWKHYPYF